MTENSYLDKFINGVKDFFTDQNSNEILKLNQAKNLKELNRTIEQIDDEIRKIVEKETGLSRIKELFSTRFNILNLYNSCKSEIGM
jgi:hypothetical protein